MHDADNELSVCPTCGGAGKTKHRKRYILKDGSVIEFGEFLVFCYDCNGTGHICSDDSAPCGNHVEN